MIRFLEPGWLLLLPPLLLTYRWLPGSRFLRIVHFTILVALVAALAHIEIKLDSSRGQLIVLCDRSDSMPPSNDTRLLETLDILEKARPTGSKLAVIGFGRKVVVERADGKGKFGGFTGAVDSSGSRLPEAIRTALSLVESNASARLLVVSDGLSDAGRLESAANEAATRKIPIDFRHVARSRAGDVAIERFDLPQTAASRESYLLSAWVTSDRDQDIRFTLRREGTVLAQGKRSLRPGRNRLTFRDIAAEAGVREYELAVEVENDETPENNRGRAVVSVSGPKPILHVSEGTTRLAKLLREGGLDVESVTGEELQNRGVTLGLLGRYSAVILENVATQRLGTLGMQTVAQWTTQAGNGLWITGGKNSYAVGGYYQSPLDEIMPLSMELRKEHRKVAVAMVVVLDRSGSMTAPVGGGKNKMDLANQGTAEVYNLLTPLDDFACIAVDSAPHVVVPLSPVDAAKSAKGKILSIESMGGGIFVYEGLKGAVRELKKATAGVRHIILFADAADAEEPGDYKKLLAVCRAAGITCSVIGLGSKSDPDGNLLEDVAKRGGGRSFFTNRPSDLPRLFAQDTFVVARNSFIDTRTTVAATAGLTTLSGEGFGDIPDVGGYNLAYLRPEATLAAVAKDEYNTPLLASWNSGLGRVLCYTGEIDGKYTGPIGKWDRAGSFLTTLGRWTAGVDRPLPPEMLPQQKLIGETNRVRLYLDPARRGEPFKRMPKVHVLHGSRDGAPASETYSMRWETPDILQVDVPMRSDDVALATIEVPGKGKANLGPVCLPYSREYQPYPPGTGTANLRDLASISGGQERTDLETIWASLPERARYFPLAPWLATFAAMLILVEVFQRRTGWLTFPKRTITNKAVQSEEKENRKKQLPTVSFEHKRRNRPKKSDGPVPASKASQKEDAPPRKPGKTQPTQPKPKKPVAPADDDASDLLDAFKNAGDRARRRTDQK